MFCANNANEKLIKTLVRRRLVISVYLTINTILDLRKRQNGSKATIFNIKLVAEIQNEGDLSENLGNVRNVIFFIRRFFHIAHYTFALPLGSNPNDCIFLFRKRQLHLP